jgi:ribosomal-protein-alanine N-acetyltransferase
LDDGPIRLRPLRRRDAREWRSLRVANMEWLSPWEATHPAGEIAGPTFHQMVHRLDREARAGRILPFAVEYDGRFVGQVTVGGIILGSLRSGHIGYWIDREMAGRGIIPTAVAMVTDHCFLTVGLHRLEINIRPQNSASLRVVEKLGFRLEGVRERYLHIDGAWRDHATFALTAEEVPGGVLRRWRGGRHTPWVDDRADSLPPFLPGAAPRRHTVDGA